MRTTITLSDDVARAVDKLRLERSVGISEVVNELVRAGLSAAKQPRRPFRQRTRSLGLRLDVTDVADAIETLDGPASP